MEPVTVLIGAAAFCFGLFTQYTRKKDPSKLKKLEAMKKFWGEQCGDNIHFIAYTVMPLIVGAAFVVQGFMGVKLF